MGFWFVLVRGMDLTKPCSFPMPWYRRTRGDVGNGITFPLSPTSSLLNRPQEMPKDMCNHNGKPSSKEPISNELRTPSPPSSFSFLTYALQAAEVLRSYLCYFYWHRIDLQVNALHSLHLEWFTFPPVFLASFTGKSSHFADMILNFLLPEEIILSTVVPNSTNTSTKQPRWEDL